MELILELIMELLIEGTFEGAESDNVPMQLRILLATIISAVFIGLIVVFVLAYLQGGSVVMLGIAILAGLLFAYVIGRMWVRIARKLAKNKR